MDPFDASAIINWSDMPDAHHQLPTLIRRLVHATANVSDIDMPSGSSTRLGGWDGLITATDGHPKVPEGQSGWELSCDKDPRAKATNDYDKRTEEPLGVDVANATFVFATSRRWPGKRAWVQERREHGPWADVRVIDADDLVDWLEQAHQVAIWFAGVIGNGSPALDEIRELVARQGELSAEAKSATLSHIDDGLADLKAHISSLFPSNSAVLGEPAEPEQYCDPVTRALARRIDGARDLIGKNLVHTARVVLEQMLNEDEAPPPELKFRIITNLAVCALVDDDFDRARMLLEEAHELQPESRTAITNAALAAQLAKNPERTIELANRARELETENSEATAILMQALWEVGNTEHLEDLIATDVWTTQDRGCVSVLATIRQQQSRFDDAAALLQSLIEEDPEDAYSHLALSQCLISHSQADYRSGLHTEDIFVRLRKAEYEATRAIDLLRATELRAQLQNALVARACARALLEANSDALADLDEVLAASPNHPTAAFNKGLLLQREGRLTEARKVLENIEDPARRADAALPLAESYLADGHGAAAIGLIRDTFQLELPAWEDVHRAGILCRAEAAETGECSVDDLLKVALQQEPESTRLLTLRGLCLSIHGDLVGCEKALLKALEHADDLDRPQVLVRLGFYYQDQLRFSEAADCIAQVVCGVVSHPLAISLSICLANGKRLREALQWARDIQEVHRQVPREAIDIEAQILGHIGDASAAVECYQKLCLHPHATPGDRITLAAAQLRCKDHGSALETILSIDPAELRAEPKLLLAAAQMKWFVGAEGYLEDAYVARRHGTNDPDIHVGYIQLCLSREEDVGGPSSVGSGCAVLLKSEGTETWWHILDSAEDALGPHDLSPGDELARLLQGRRTGETITLSQPIGERHYEITAIQSKFVRAFQDTIEEFPIRFPEDTRLSTFAIEDDDPAVIYQFVDRRAQFVRDVNQVYKDGGLPFATFSSLVGRSPLEMWRASTRDPSGRVRFGTGTREETGLSADALRDADDVVLDMLALLTVHELGIAEHLRKRFQRVTMPQRVVDEIHITLFNIEESAPTGYFGRDSSGRGTLTDVSEKAWMEWLDYVRSVLKLAESFEIVASYRLLDVDDSAEYFDTLTPSGAGAVFAGVAQPSNKLVLISDDLVLSNIARGFGVEAANTQAVLEELQRSGVITNAEYSSFVERLAQLNYWFVRVSADDILRSLETSAFTTTEGARAMFKTLQGPHCDEGPAISVVAAILAGLVDKATHEQLALILSLGIATLCHERMARPVLLQFRDRIASQLALYPMALSHVLRTVETYIRTSSIMV